jgi:hypothetical protein
MTEESSLLRYIAETEQRILAQQERIVQLQAQNQSIQYAEWLLATIEVAFESRIDVLRRRAEAGNCSLETH